MCLKLGWLYSGILFFYCNISVALDLGASIPECVLKNIADGSNIQLRQSGKVLYIDFWASWCAPCAQSLPFLESLNQEFQNKNFEVIAINLDEVKSDADNFLHQHPLKLTTAINPDGACPNLFQVQAMPSSYLIDRHGKVRHIQLGFNQAEKNQLRQRLEKVLNE